MGQSPSGDTCNEIGDGTPLLNGPTEFGSKHPHPVQFTTDAKKTSLPGDLLFCVRGSTTGRMNWANKKYAIGRGLAAIRGKNGYPNAFVRAVIEVNLESLLIQATGSTFPNVSRDLISSLSIPSISPESAKVVAAILEPLDDRITLLRETNATLEAIAQALFKSWFIDFDPVHAKQQGRTPEGMDEATAALFPDGFEESELGMVPRGWRLGTLIDVAQTARRQLQVSELHADLHYVGLEHIPRKSLCLTDWGNAEGLESAKAAFAEDDILFGKLRPYFHKVVIAPFSGVCSTDILVCQTTKPAYFGLAAMHLFSAPLIDYADRLSNGAKMPRVNWKDLAAYPICVPPEPPAAAFNQVIEPLIARMKANVHQAQTLTTLRDTLLPRLISGQLRLPEAESITEEAVS